VAAPVILGGVLLPWCSFVGLPCGHHDSMDVADFSFLRTGGVLLRGVLLWNAPWAL